MSFNGRNRPSRCPAMALFPASHGRGVSGRCPTAISRVAASSPRMTGVESDNRGISSSPIKSVSRSAAVAPAADAAADSLAATRGGGSGSGPASRRRSNSAACCWRTIPAPSVTAPNHPRQPNPTTRSRRWSQRRAALIASLRRRTARAAPGSRHGSAPARCGRRGDGRRLAACAATHRASDSSGRSQACRWRGCRGRYA